jgi:hypothetical protein
MRATAQQRPAIHVQTIMRSAVAVAVAFALWPGSTAPREADASTRAPPSGAVAASAAVASPESAAIAYLLAPGRLRVRVPGVGTRDYAVPADCEPQALARDAVFLCGGFLPGTRPLLALRPADGTLTPVPVALERGQVFYPRQAGRGWIAGVLSFASTGGSGKDVEERVIVSRADGAVVNLYVGFRTAPPGWGPDRYVDLSADSPLRRLCRPLGRDAATDERPESRARLMKVGPWTLRPVARNRWWIQRCGSRRVVRAGPSAVLGPGHAAWLGPPDADERVLRLRDLAAGTTRSFALLRSSSGYLRPVIAFTSDRLVVSQPAGVEHGRTSWVVRTIPFG